MVQCASVCHIFTFNLVYRFFSDENLSLGLESGMVIGVPIPEAGNSLGQEIEDAIQSALKLAQ